jgi:hypothetical protein
MKEKTEDLTPHVLMQTGIATVTIHQVVMRRGDILLVIVMCLGTQFTAIVNAALSVIGLDLGRQKSGGLQVISSAIVVGKFAALLKVT